MIMVHIIVEPIADTDPFDTSFTGYDYVNQCRIVRGIIQRCGHPDSMQCNCYGRIHAGESVKMIDL